MNFNRHSNLEGQHAFLGASKYHWINYTDDKIADSYVRFLATQKGTVLHAFAAQCILLGQKLPKSQKTLNMYVNDAIGYKMTPEQILYYSPNCFGTTDAICFRNNFLRIHDLKTGEIDAHIEQLEVYAALFCLEYHIRPADIEMELRIYQHDQILYHMSILKGDYPNPHVSIWWYKLDSVDEVGYPEMWMKANPNIGKTVSYETYQLDVERAEKAPAARNDILAKRFGLPMEGYTYYFTYEETLPHRKRDYWQMACALGGDLSQGDDFCSFTFLFPLRNGSFGVKTRNYITSRTLNKLPAAMRNKYEQFMDEGSLVVLDGTVLDPMQVYEDLDEYIVACGYDVRCFGYDPYNAKEFVERWAAENGPFGIEKVIQGAKTESVPLGELKKLAEDRMLLFDEELMTYAMGNCIAMEDTNGNRKLMKKRYEQKIDAVSAMMDAYIAYKRNPEAFE